MACFCFVFVFFSIVCFSVCYVELLLFTMCKIFLHVRLIYADKYYLFTLFILEDGSRGRKQRDRQTDGQTDELTGEWCRPCAGSRRRRRSVECTCESRVRRVVYGCRCETWGRHLHTAPSPGSSCSPSPSPPSHRPAIIRIQPVLFKVIERHRPNP